MNYRQQMDKISAHVFSYTQLYYECAKLSGMTYNTMIVLYALRQMQPCTQKQIAVQCGLPKQSVNTIIKKFHNEQYVEFLQGNNKKEKLLQFTHEGKELADSKLQPILDMEERILQRMGEEDSRQLEKNMAVFTHFFQEEFLAYKKSF